MARCEVCSRKCEIPEGKLGSCGARTCLDGAVRAANYGRITALQLDPVDKKPLRRFRPGSRILSVGSYGCNLRCPFCQNNEISWSGEALREGARARTVTPEELVRTAVRARERGNIGLAFIYNEPLVGWEFVLDAAREARRAGLVNVLVTNGTADLPVLDAVGPYMDAMNIDLKGFTKRYYRDILGGDLDMVKRFILRASGLCHVELTTLIVPGENDSEAEMAEMSRWIAEEVGPETPLHVSRFFPRFHMTDRAATDVRAVYRLAETARERLRYVYTGNC